MLRRPDRSPHLYLKVLLDYSVILDARGHVRPGYRAEVSRYVYAVQDLSGREVFAYHWHPIGPSDVWTPHLHVSAAGTISLPHRSARQNDNVPLGRLHFPTHRIELPELVRFLIDDLGVGPRRPDWEAILDRIERTSR